MTTQARPLIGLSVYREQARTGVWDTVFDLLPSDYARSVEAAGGIPVLLPPVLPYAEAALRVVAGLDGLIVTGGADVDPATYHQPAHPRTGRPRVDRDAWEFALLDAAAALGTATLGICRGMQVMAVHAGGSLVQHVPDLVANEDHDPGGDVYGRTTVSVVPDSRLASLLADGPPVVSCHHHQSVREHPGFIAAAHAADGLLEAMEDPSARFRLAVQWHPEVDPDAGVVAGLVAAARGHAGVTWRGVLFDFNGTLSDDEAILERVFGELFAQELGWQLPPEFYRTRMLGRSDREIIEIALTWTGQPAARVDSLLVERGHRYRAAVAARSPITTGAAALVERLARSRVPMAVVTGAQRGDVEAVLAAGPTGQFLTTVVTEEDVQVGKPDPEGFLAGAALIGVQPSQVLVFEDSIPGIEAAAAAGMSVIAVTGPDPNPQVVALDVPKVRALVPELLDLHTDGTVTLAPGRLRQ